MYALAMILSWIGVHAVLGTNPASFTLDGTTALHPYDGHGALSAGASSRLLWDYQEPYRSQILDYLFKPNFGAGLHTLKVEIGGDAQSTDGTEPSHMHTRNDLSCTRGYELWLIQQAKARNPQIQTYGLSWGIPNWVGNGTYYSQDNVDYQVQWMSCIAQQSGHVLDYMGLWNEKPQPSSDYVLQLRAAMDGAGFGATKIIVMDGGYDTAEVTMAQTNSSYAAAIHGAGLHYPCDNPQPDVQELGWTFWASEDYSRDPAWANGGTYWGKALSQNYVLMNMTATISWSLIWSAYTNLVCNGAGLMRAHEPWSGNYEASAPIWLSAHWTQFVTPGWRFLHVPGGGSGLLPGNGGTYVTLVPPTGLADVTIIVETLNNNDCKARNQSDWEVTFHLTGGLPGPGTVLHVWMTTSVSYFVQLADVTVDATGSFTASVQADAMMTFSTVSGAQHGTFPGSSIPVSQPWALPYSDDFNVYPYDAMAAYWSDQGGSWAARNGSLVQVAPVNPGPNGWAANPDPLSQLGDPNWADYAVAADAVFSPISSVEQSQVSVSALQVKGSSRSGKKKAGSERVKQWRQWQGLPAVQEQDRTGLGDVATQMMPCDSSDPAQSWLFNVPSPGYLSNTVFSNQLCLNIGGCEANDIIYYQCVDDPNGSSCGAPAGQYPNLQWSLNATGAVSSPEPGLGGFALTIWPGNRSLYMSPTFTGQPTQVWAYNSSSGQLSLPGLGLCLSTPPVRSYVQVCARITSFDGFNAQSGMPGYCLQVDHVGKWTLVSGGVTLTNGLLPGQFNPQTTHRLAVSCAGPVISAFVDGTMVTQVTDGTYVIGNAAIGSGWHSASFDNFNATLPL